MEWTVKGGQPGGSSYGLVHQLISICHETAYRTRSLLPTEPETSIASLHVRLLCWPLLPEFLAKKAKRRKKNRFGGNYLFSFNGAKPDLGETSQVNRITPHSPVGRQTSRDPQSFNKHQRSYIYRNPVNFILSPYI